MPDFEHFTEAEIIDALKSSGGFVSHAAEKLNCSPATIYNYMQRYPSIKAAKEDIETKTLDFAESKLLQAIAEGNMTAIIFFLKCKGKKRGYVEGFQPIGVDGEPLTVIKFVLVENGTSAAGDKDIPGNGER